MVSTAKYRFKLEKGSKKHLCPNCGKKRFVRYLDADTSEYLPEQYGRCDREENCGYHLNPYVDGYGKMIWEKEQGSYSENWKPRKSPKLIKKNLTKPHIQFIPFEVLQRTLKDYEQNVFLQNLLSIVPFPFDAKDIERIIELYYLGTVSKGYRKGAITFPFIDKDEHIRAIQVKQFDCANHTTGTDFLHTIIKRNALKKNESLPQWLEAYHKQDKKVSCLFGEHLLSKYPCNPISLVEAPKTAIYGTLYFGFPELYENYLWLAVYNLSSLNFEKCKALHGRDVYLFPDLSKDGKAFDLWSRKARELERLIPGTNFIVSDLLEQNASEAEKAQGLDLADYLIKQNWRTFRGQTNEKSTPQKKSIVLPGYEKHEKYESSKKTYFSLDEDLPGTQPTFLDEPDAIKKEDKESWEKDIAELVAFFSNTKLPSNPLNFNEYSTIANVHKFVESHMNVVKANDGERAYLPYLHRLQELKSILIGTSDVQIC